MACRSCGSAHKHWLRQARSFSHTATCLLPAACCLPFWQGPKDTPFEGGTFELCLKVPEQYPLVPPKVHYVTRVFHPNVHFKTGEICLDILNNAWSPAWTLHSVCQAVLALMSDSAPDSPLNCDAGALLLLFVAPMRPGGACACGCSLWPSRNPTHCLCVLLLPQATCCAAATCVATTAWPRCTPLSMRCLDPRRPAPVVPRRCSSPAGRSTCS